MKILKWISISIAALFTTGCAVDIRPHHRHVRVQYDTWDCEPNHGFYFESRYSSHGYHRGHGHHGRKKRCR